MYEQFHKEHSYNLKFRLMEVGLLEVILEALYQRF